MDEERVVVRGGETLVLKAEGRTSLVKVDEISPGSEADDLAFFLQRFGSEAGKWWANENKGP